MRKAIAVTLLAIVFAACAVGTNAIGKVTIDPNTPGNKQTDPIDTRISQKVTYTAKKQCISAILDDLTKISGVTLNAGYNDQDWQVRDRRMNIFVKDLPLSELMNSIARTMKFLWKKEGDPAKPSYRLYMDRAAVLTAEIRRQLLAQQADDRVTQARLSMLDTLSSLAEIPSNDIDKLKQDDPYGWALASSGVAKSMSDFFRECPDAGQAFADGTTWFAEGQKLSPAAQEAMLRMVDPLFKFEVFYQKDQVPLPTDLASKLDQMSVYIGAGDIEQGVIGRISINLPPQDWNGANYTQVTSAGFLVPGSAWAKGQGQWIIEQWDNKTVWDGSQEAWQKTAALNEVQWHTWDNESGPYIADTREPYAPHPSDPDLQNKKALIKIDKTKKYGIDDFEEMLAQYFGMNVVADTYTWHRDGTFVTSYDTLSMTGKESTLESVLKLFGGSNWWKRGSLIEVRYRNWYLERMDQVPEAWLSYWREVFKTTGMLDIEELAQIANLTRAQYEKNIQNDDILTNRKGKDSELGMIFDERFSSSSLLRLYAALSKTQRAATFKPKGFELLSLRSERRAVLGAFGGPATSPGSYLNPQSGVTSVRLLTTRKAEGKRLRYDFTLKITDAQGTHDKPYGGFLTPLYVEPPKEGQKSGVELSPAK